MFARIISLQLKPNASKEFTELLEKQIVPALRKQRGFKDEMLFIVPGGPEVVAISLWESKADAEAYQRESYPQMLKKLAKVIEKAPEVKTYELGYSTLHKLGATAFLNQSPNTTPAAGVGG
jgi:heme-degrading monooxygenase HmoA